MKLLPPDRLVQTSRIDHADWNYRPILGFVSRRRFALALDLLGHERFHRLLEVGYGSGVFLPELSKHCDELYGIDPHDAREAVESQLLQVGITARLLREDAAQTSFPDGHFDAIVCVSALEFVNDIERASSELARVLSPDGRLIVVMPNDSPLLDFALLVATRESAHRDFGDRRGAVLPALMKRFRIRKRAVFPPMYTAFQFERLS